MREQLVLFAAFLTFHTRQRAQPPTSLREAERRTLVGQLLGVRGHSGCYVHRRVEGAVGGQPNTLGCKCLPCLQPVISLPLPDVSSSILRGKRPFQSYIYLLREGAQRVKELMFIVSCSPQREIMDKHKVWLWLIQDLISGCW